MFHARETHGFFRGGAGAARGVHPSGPILPSVLTALDWMHRFAAKVANSAPTGMSATATPNPALSTMDVVDASAVQMLP